MTLFADIQRPNYKFAHDPHPVNIQLFNPCPLYSFTIMVKYSFVLISLDPPTIELPIVGTKDDKIYLQLLYALLKLVDR